MSTITIKHRFTDAVLYTHKTTDERQASGLALRDALEAACKSGANLSGANLSGAYLSGAYLRDTNLRGANLSGANLSDTNLRGANLSDTNLSDSKVNGLELVGARPFMAIGPIGSESRTINVWLTADGLRIQAGCFFGSRAEFVAKLEQTHGDNVHAQEYTAALVLIDMHAKLWGAQ